MEQKPTEKKEEKKIFNEAVITGAVTKLKEVKYKSGDTEKSLYNLDIVVKGKPDAQGQVRSNYFTIIVPDKNKDAMSEIKQGTEVKINGFITTEKNEYQGQRYVTDKILAISISKNKDFIPKHGAYIQFSGLLTSNIELETKGENKYAKFAFAQNVGKDENKKAIFKNSVDYKEVAEQMSTLKQSDFVRVEGILRSNSYQKGDTGAKYSVYDITVLKFKKLEKNISIENTISPDKSEEKKINTSKNLPEKPAIQDQELKPEKVSSKQSQPLDSVEKSTGLELEKEPTKKNKSKDLFVSEEDDVTKKLKI